MLFNNFYYIIIKNAKGETIGVSERIIEYITIFLALMIVLPVHEFAHGFAAVKFGDITPKINGRYTLNPLAHFDPIGLVSFVLAGFGWAKPMPVNPSNFRKYKSGCFWVSVAGVIANYITSFIAYPLFLLIIYFMPDIGFLDDVLWGTAWYVFAFGLTFFVFNLLPIYPLDGFRVVEVFNKRRGPVYRFLRNYGVYILYALFILSFIADLTGFYQIDILGYVINFFVGYLQMPIVLFWGLIF